MLGYIKVQNDAAVPMTPQPHP